jgi:hypothetical protein
LRRSGPALGKEQVPTYYLDGGRVGGRRRARLTLEPMPISLCATNPRSLSQQPVAMPTRSNSPAQERRPHAVAQLFWRLGRAAENPAVARRHAEPVDGATLPCASRGRPNAQPWCERTVHKRGRPCAGCGRLSPRPPWAPFSWSLTGPAPPCAVVWRRAQVPQSRKA